MKLFLVHCGLYDSDLSEGVYEFHVNFFVAAESFDDARLRVKEIPQFKIKKMHVDGIQEVAAVDGWKVDLNFDPELNGKSKINNNRDRDLARKTQ